MSKGNGPQKEQAFPVSHPRYEQTFPALTPQEIERIRHFGSPRKYKDGEKLFETGKPGPGMFIVLSGHVAIIERDGLGHSIPIIEQGPGQFLAELGQLSGRAALVDGVAEGEVETLLIPSPKVRELLIAEAELGERIMRALILRRVALIQDARGGPAMIGPRDDPDMVRLLGFLTRNGYPHHVMDPAEDHEAAELIAKHKPTEEEIPLVVCPDGTLLKNPREADLARTLGMFKKPDCSTLYDVAVVGGGPAGLATAVYAASEGLSVAVLDQRAFGGQAGASSRIENYLGFPTGISGMALAGRAFTQAQKFGVEMMIPVEVKSLDCARKDGLFGLSIDTGDTLRARSVVVASGARYRRLALGNLKDFEGHGIWYWASPIEAQLVKDQEVILVGGGNSAGQGAVFLSSVAAKVRMMCRKPGLAETMSSYLIDRIEATPNIELLTETEIVSLEGDRDTGLQGVRWRTRGKGECSAPIRHVFLFVGADPATSWLDGCGVQVDRSGFVLTGAAAADGNRNPSSTLESSVPGVFAVGDVRAGSVKRVGGAIGEGAMVVPALHGFLANHPARQQS
jgi:thioredoxin reductase (NADPH)